MFSYFKKKVKGGFVKGDINIRQLDSSIVCIKVKEEKIAEKKKPTKNSIARETRNISCFFFVSM